MKFITGFLVPCCLTSSFFLSLPGNIMTLMPPKGTSTMYSGGYNISKPGEIYLYAPNFICHAIIFLAFTSPIYYLTFKKWPTTTGKSMVSILLICLATGSLFSCLAPAGMYNIPPIGTKFEQNGILNVHSDKPSETKPLNFYTHTLCFFVTIMLFFTMLGCNKLNISGMMIS